MKVLLRLTELHLSAQNSVILMDEIENSLGPNCLPALVDLFLVERRDLQFILTSHHPYVLNNIDHSHWKILTRDGSVVTAHDASEFHIGESYQKAYIELINHPAYETGRMEVGQG